MRIYLVICLFVSLLVSCKEPTAETSVYKNDILKLDSTFNVVTKNYEEFQTIDKEELHVKLSKGKNLYDSARAMYKSDTLVIDYDYILAVMKATYVKGGKKILAKEAGIDEEYTYSKNQYTNLRDDLVKELFTSDTAALYLSSELNALDELNNTIIQYNSLANKALNDYDSLTNRLAEIVEKYGVNE